MPLLLQSSPSSTAYSCVVTGTTRSSHRTKAGEDKSFAIWPDVNRAVQPPADSNLLVSTTQVCRIMLATKKADAGREETQEAQAVKEAVQAL